MYSTAASAMRHNRQPAIGDPAVDVVIVPFDAMVRRYIPDQIHRATEQLQEMVRSVQARKCTVLAHAVLNRTSRGAIKCT